MKPQEQMTDEEFLQHHGVKGMKWGVRRSQAELDRAAGRTPSKGRLGSSSRKRKSSAPPASSMDDNQLRQRINRLQMEKQYNELTASKTGAGRKFAKKALGTAGTAIVVSQLTKGGNKAVDAGVAYLGSYVRRKIGL